MTRENKQTLFNFAFGAMICVITITNYHMFSEIEGIRHDHDACEREYVLDTTVVDSTFHARIPIYKEKR